MLTVREQPSGQWLWTAQLDWAPEWAECGVAGNELAARRQAREALAAMEAMAAD